MAKSEFDVVAVGAGFGGLDWSEHYASQPEILDYANHVADRFQGRHFHTGDWPEEGVDLVNEVADKPIYPTCNSWHLGVNIPGKPKVLTPYLAFPPTWRSATRSRQVIS